MKCHPAPTSLYLILLWFWMQLPGFVSLLCPSLSPPSSTVCHLLWAELAHPYTSSPTCCQLAHQPLHKCSGLFVNQLHGRTLAAQNILSNSYVESDVPYLTCSSSAPVNPAAALRVILHHFLGLLLTCLEGSLSIYHLVQDLQSYLLHSSSTRPTGLNSLDKDNNPDNTLQ